MVKGLHVSKGICLMEDTPDEASGDRTLLPFHCSSFVTLNKPLRCQPLGTQRRVSKGLELRRLTVTTEMWQAMTRKENEENKNPEGGFLTTGLEECRM